MKVLLKLFDSQAVYCTCTVDELDSVLNEYFGNEDWYIGRHIVFDKHGRAAMTLKYTYPTDDSVVYAEEP